MTLDYIDPWQPDMWPALRERVNTRAVSEHCYLLVDTAFMPGAHHKLLSHGQWQALFDGNPSDTEELRSVSPWLGHCPELSDDLGQVLSSFSGAPNLSAIVTPEPFESLLRRMKPWCLTNIDGQWFNLRFPDTRRLPGIWAALTTDQRQTFIGQASAWHFIDRDGSWNALPNVTPAHPPALDEVKLDVKQFNQILDGCRADEILFRLLTQGRHDDVKHSLKFHAARRAVASLSNDETDMDELMDVFEIELRRSPQPQL